MYVSGLSLFLSLSQVHVFRETGLLQCILDHVEVLSLFHSIHSNNVSHLNIPDHNTPIHTETSVPSVEGDQERGATDPNNPNNPDSLDSLDSLDRDKEGGEGFLGLLPLLYDPVTYTTAMECLVLLIGGSALNFSILIKESSSILVLLREKLYRAQAKKVNNPNNSNNPI